MWYVFDIYLLIALIVFAECLYADYGHHDAALGTTNPIWADHFIAISIDIGLAVIWPIALLGFVKKFAK